MKRVILCLVAVVSLVACTSKPNAHADFSVRGNCEMCKERIDKTVLALTGVTAANWNLETGVMAVDYDSTKTSPTVIEKVVAAVGHSTTNFPMNSVAHDKLPKCCQVNPGDAMHE